jgi:uncharacterized protein (DUF427 family)
MTQTVCPYKGLVAFFNEKVDVDGERELRPLTIWS